MRIFLIHAVQVAMEPIQQEMRQSWPEAEAFNLLDDSLEVDRSNKGTNTDQRIQMLAHYARNQGAEGILFTCSAFGEAVEAAASSIDVPVLKPNEAMFQKAIEQGGKVALVATFEPAIAGMEQEFSKMKKQMNSCVVLESFCVPKARQALKSGDKARHDQLVTELVSGLSDFDSIMLAHFSTASAKEAAQAVTRATVLTSPGSAVSLLKKRTMNNPE